MEDELDEVEGGIMEFEDKDGNCGEVWEVTPFELYSVDVEFFGVSDDVFF